METAHTKKKLAKLLHKDQEWLDYEKEYVSQYDSVITVVDERATPAFPRAATRTSA